MGAAAGLRLFGALLAILLINAVPLYGVLRLGWTVFEVMMTFWAESMIIGIITVLRVILASIVQRDWSGPFQLFNFLIAYGFGTVFHGVVVFLMFGDPVALQTQTDPFGRLFDAFLTQAWLTWPALMLLALHVAMFVIRDLLGGTIARVPVGEMIGRTTLRMVLLHLTLVFGGFAVTASGSPVGMVIMLVIIKTLIEGVQIAMDRSAASESADLSTVAQKAPVPQPIPKRQRQRRPQR